MLNIHIRPFQQPTTNYRRERINYYNPPAGEASAHSEASTGPLNILLHSYNKAQLSRHPTCTHVWMKL